MAALVVAVRVTRWTVEQERAYRESHQVRMQATPGAANHAAWKEREARNWNGGARCFSLQLPFPPSTNEMYRPGEKRGSKHLTDKHIDFRANVAGLIAIHGIRCLAGRLSFYMELRPDPKWRGDGDNLLKATWDALQHAGAITNDRCIEEFRVVRMPSVDGYPPHVVVTVHELE